MIPFIAIAVVAALTLMWVLAIRTAPIGTQCKVHGFVAGVDECPVCDDGRKV